MKYFARHETMVMGVTSCIRTKTTRILSLLSPEAPNTRKWCDLDLGQCTWGLLGSIAGSVPQYRPCRICRAVSALLPGQCRHRNLDSVDTDAR